MLDGILKNMNLFVDGRGQAGNIEEITLPKLTSKTEEFRNGGMDAPVEVEMGMEKLEMDFTLTRFDKEILKLYGLSSGNIKPLTIRGSLSSEDGTETGVIINCRGMIKEVDGGSWKPGDKATLKLSVALRYYKLTVGGEVIHEIDVPNMIRIIGGVDQLATQRANLGL
jgi:P2 family phage contractile tail tube protein